MWNSVIGSKRKNESKTTKASKRHFSQVSVGEPQPKTLASTKMAVSALGVGKVSNVALLNFCLIFRKAETASTDHFSFFLLLLAGDNILVSGCNVSAHPGMKHL